MKTEEELNALKEEFEALSQKLAELTEEEMEQVAGASLGKVSGLRKRLYKRCTNPNCDQHEWQTFQGCGATCWKCGSRVEVKYFYFP